MNNPLKLLYHPRATIPDARPQDYYLPGIAVGKEFQFSVDFHVPIMRRYLPLDFIEIHNASNTALTMQVESRSGEKYRIEAGMNRKIAVNYTLLIFANIGLNALPANTCQLILSKIGAK